MDYANNRMLSASDDLHINIYDAETYKVIQPLVGHRDIISTILVNNEKNIYASCSYDGTVKIWDTRIDTKFDCIQTLSLIRGSGCNIIWDMTMSNDANYILAGTEEGCFILGMI